MAFKNSDDFIDSYIFSKMMKLQNDHIADVRGCCVSIVSDLKSVTQAKPSPHKVCFKGVEVLPRIYQNNSISNLNLWNKSYRRDSVDSFLFKMVVICEDTDIMPLQSFKSKKVFLPHEKQYYYVHSKNSVMKSGFTQKKSYDIKAVKANKAFYISKRFKKAKLQLDTPYTFKLLKSTMLLLEDDLHDKVEEIFIFVYIYQTLFPEFLMNPYINPRQKTILCLSCFKQRKHYKVKSYYE